MNELRHAQTQLRMSENQPLRQEFFKNKIHLIEQKIKEASKNWTLIYHELVKLYTWLIQELVKLVKNAIGNYHKNEKILFV